MATITPKIASTVPNIGLNPSPKTAAEIPKENSVTKLMKKIWKPRRDISFQYRIGSWNANPVNANNPIANSTVINRIR